MSKRPTGTMDVDRLLELRVADAVLPAETDSDPLPAAADQRRTESGDERTYVVNITDLVERTELPPDPIIDWSTDDRDADPMLVFAPLPPDEIDDAAFPRRVIETDDGTYAPVPDDLLRIDPSSGLGIDLAAYDDDNPLLFEAVATDETIGLLPARFADGTPFDAEPLPETPSESDPVAEETLAHEFGADTDAEAGTRATPRLETVDAPIDAEIIATVVDETETAESELADALERIHQYDLLSIEDIVPGREPLSVDGRVIFPVPADAWTVEVGAELDADEGVLEAARTAHERQANRLLERAEATDYRDELADDEFAVAVTVELDTTEWSNTGESG
ncbi:hypothetical protein [Natrialba asiatica]|uniref:DUF8048 domain-containing protein n=1 Tax=Natrialba asiatica (strain ATCC 700177 / DSM 12278 / JCM 9576 / FERM P-10747 / NBRC 102637 / 172P1) TaxID=29540 RepID=M0AX31_NATA1|nr:hypothetical protein [Natrialba asiatica]ELZ01974.1 hypothetical protein C481_08923 [Natrialba asiatica DSM 12278]